MASKKYGVWAAKPTSYDAQTPKQDPKTPHITLQLSGGGSAEINVKSTSSDDRLVFWVNKSFLHPITSALSQLAPGLTENPSESTSLDFQRTTPALLDVNAGTLLDPYEKGPDNDILDELEPILDQAIHEGAMVYLFGQFYHDRDGASGIHDCHMNQGNSGGGDGSFMVQFNDGHWEAVFLAFATQSLPTDDEGKPTSDAEAFDQRLGGSSSSS
ncbi:Hypothetical predicted protein [Lecanosticta acicola]|uniref:DUF2278 family protein n=1 Tax=Lecanosticta acicola TaxID=111012 RepID=A0AAI9E5U3_9PEZI|nr:Hypothetical predicted protein [Lecanosticta acicola]